MGIADHHALKMKLALLGVSAVATLLATIGGGCVNSQAKPNTVAIARLARGVTPLSELDNVVLGMSVARLRRVRPLAFLAPYEGLREVIAGDTIIYHVRPAYLSVTTPDNGHPGEDMPLEAVEIRRWITAPDSSALPVWASLVRRVHSGPGGPPRCFAFVSGLTGGTGAIFEQGATAFAVLFTQSWASPSKISEARHYPPMVRVIVTGDFKKTSPDVRPSVGDERCPAP